MEGVKLDEDKTKLLGFDDMTIHAVYKQEVKETLHRDDIHFKIITTHKATITCEYQQIHNT